MKTNKTTFQLPWQDPWQNHKIKVSPMAKIRLTLNFVRVIEPHSGFHEWSRMTKFKVKLADGCHIWKCWKYYITRLPLDQYGENLGGHIPSRPRHVHHDVDAKCMNQFWWNLVHSNKLETPW